MRNSTIIPRKKECVSCGRSSYIFSAGMCKECSTINSYHKRLAKVTEQEDGLPELIERLDTLVSKWVRFSAVSTSGAVECYTCENFFLPTNIDAGHYITRSCMYLRFDVSRNIRPQCVTCNRAKYGMAAAFGKRLEADMPGVTEILLDESRIIHHWTREELKQMIREYQQKLKNLK